MSLIKNKKWILGMSAALTILVLSGVYLTTELRAQDQQQQQSETGLIGGTGEVGQVGFIGVNPDVVPPGEVAVNLDPDTPVFENPNDVEGGVGLISFLQEAGVPFNFSAQVEFGEPQPSPVTIDFVSVPDQPDGTGISGSCTVPENGNECSAALTVTMSPEAPEGTLIGHDVEVRANNDPVGELTLYRVRVKERPDVTDMGDYQPLAPCLADINVPANPIDNYPRHLQDLRVDVSDLLVLLANWHSFNFPGPDNPPYTDSAHGQQHHRAGDIASYLDHPVLPIWAGSGWNGYVQVVDLLKLLASWGDVPACDKHELESPHPQSDPLELTVGEPVTVPITVGRVPHPNYGLGSEIEFESVSLDYGNGINPDGFDIDLGSSCTPTAASGHICNIEVEIAAMAGATSQEIIFESFSNVFLDGGWEFPQTSVWVEVGDGGWGFDFELENDHSDEASALSTNQGGGYEVDIVVENTSVDPISYEVELIGLPITALNNEGVRLINKAGQDPACEPDFGSSCNITVYVLVDEDAVTGDGFLILLEGVGAGSSEFTPIFVNVSDEEVCPGSGESCPN